MHISLLIQTRLLFNEQIIYYYNSNNCYLYSAFPTTKITLEVRLKEQRQIDINTRRIMDYGLVFWPEETVWGKKHLNDEVVLIICGFLWCFYQLFGLSIILTAPIHCRMGFPNLFWWINNLICISDVLRVSQFSAYSHFWVKYSFKNNLISQLLSTYYLSW